MNPHQTESTILAFFAGAILGLLLSSVIHWAVNKPNSVVIHVSEQGFTVKEATK